uniref:PCI domain-containing protein n=1 Tax=Lotharella oceanica TaxID=641309 RepID=A0A7S2TF79_9EUKA
MAYVNLVEEDQLAEFATLLGELGGENKVEELKKLEGPGALIEKGFVPTLPKILESKKKSALDAAVVMCFAALTKLEGTEKDKHVLMVKDALVAREKDMESMHLLAMLTTLFNLLDANSKARFSMFMVLAERAISGEVAPWLLDKQILANVESFRTSWGLGVHDYSKLLLALLNLCQAADKKREFGDLLLKYLETLDQDKDSDVKEALKKAKDWTIQAVLSFIRAPFDAARRMRQMVALQAVQQLKGTEDEPLLKLLSFYVDEDFKGYLKFGESKANLDYMAKRHISHDLNIRHFRVFAACKLPLGEYTYGVIEKALEVGEGEDIESAIIDLVQSKRVDVKIDQAQGLIHIRHTAQRDFKDAQWQELGQQLSNWKEGVKSVLEQMHKARQM